MKQQIKEVQDYFKQKILNNEFEIVEITEHTLVILVEKEYKFTLWIANLDTLFYLRLYESHYNFIDFTFSAKEKKQLHNLINTPIKNYKKEVLIKQKEEELKQLRDE